MATPDPFAQFKDAPAVDAFAHFQDAPPEMTTGQQIGYTALGAAKEAGSQAAGLGQMAGKAVSTLVPGTDAWKEQLRKSRLQFTPEETAAAKQWGSDISQAVRHPYDTAVNAASQWMGKVLPTPTTPAQAQERGAAGLRGAENLIPGGGAVRNVARIGAGAIERGLAPAAEKLAASGEAKVAATNIERTAENARITRLKEMGYTQPPTTGGGGLVGRFGEAVGGQLETEYAASRKNSRVSNRKAADEIGISKGKPLTEETVEEKKQEAFSVYKRVRDASKKIGRVSPDEQFAAEMGSVLERTAEEKADFPRVKHPEIEAEIDAHMFDSASSASMLDRIKALRQSASKNMKALTDKDFELGLAQKKIATALENQMDRHVATSDPSLIADLRKARTQLAKIYSIEDALTPNGNVSPAVLARQLKRGVPLSGGLKDIAEAFQMNKRAMRTVDDLGGKGEFSRLDLLVGGAEMLAHPEKAGIIAAAMGARPIARAAITSGAYQSRAIGPRIAKPGLVTRAARNIAEAGKAPQTLESVGKKPKGNRKPMTIEERNRDAG